MNFAMGIISKYEKQKAATRPLYSSFVGWSFEAVLVLSRDVNISLDKCQFSFSPADSLLHYSQDKYCER